MLFANLCIREHLVARGHKLGVLGTELLKLRLRGGGPGSGGGRALIGNEPVSMRAQQRGRSLSAAHLGNFPQPRLEPQLRRGRECGKIVAD